MSPCKHPIVFKTFSHSVFLKHHAMGRGGIITLFYKCLNGLFQNIEIYTRLHNCVPETKLAQFHLGSTDTLERNFAIKVEEMAWENSSDFKIQDIFVMFITIYPNNLKNFVCLYFSVFKIMKLFLNNLVFILDSNPECVHHCSFPLVSYFCVSCLS